MSDQTVAEGAIAFGEGRERGSNPYDPNSKAWHHWRDGWDQANAAAQADPTNANAGAPDFLVVYRSSNGDDWLLGRDATRQDIVVHRPNRSSGGRERSMPVEEFLERSAGSPEAGAVQAIMAARMLVNVSG